MGPVNWFAVVLAAVVAVAIGLVWHGLVFRTGKPLVPGYSRPAGGYALVILIVLIGSIMLGHSFARIGTETLDAKPWLYFMQTGGIAIAFIIPSLWLTLMRMGSSVGERIIESGYWLVAYLAMGAVFWAIG